MCIQERGPVQHLASTVSGSLSSFHGTDSWAALDVLFPSITASGIPKATALQAIQRLEDRPRELYSGAIILLDGSNIEATLCLRTVFQDKDRQVSPCILVTYLLYVYEANWLKWLQAGAGIIAPSQPERELVETKEKLASIAPYIVYASE